MTHSALPADLALAGLLGLAACAPASGTMAPSAGAPGGDEPARSATVVAVRPVPAPGNDMRGTILGAIGTGGATEPGTEATCEFILRTDNGQTISVVQANAEGLHAGEHVVLSMGPRRRVARAGN